ncbi:hypothetical protein [Streptomyces sp. cf386]|uniref:hypothetical protein n=1 Tax=Streptomyces sp. cf386 TaxID=1761904 RepID=UPI000B31F79F
MHDAWWKAASRAHGDAAGTRALIEVLLLHRRMSHDHVIAGIAAALRAGALTVDAVALEARRTAGRVTPGEAGPYTALGPFASPVALLTARRPAELPPDPGRCLRWPPTTNSCVIPGHRPGVLPDEGAPP